MLSVRTKSPSFKVGTTARGLRARYSRVRVAPSAMTVRTVSKGAPISSRAMCEAREQAPGE